MNSRNEALFAVEQGAPNWDIPGIVAALRELRDASLEGRARRGKPPKLPSRKALIEILDGLRATLFPNRLGCSSLSDEGVDYFVGHTLDAALRELLEQVHLELKFSAYQDDVRDAFRDQAIVIAREFAAGLPRLRALLETDLAAAYSGDPAARGLDEILVCYPGMTSITCHRFAHELNRLGAPLIARMIAEISHSTTGIDIHPGAQIGPSFFIDHGTGVVIGETAVIGERVRLYQAVTLGAKRFEADDKGDLVKGSARHPVIGNDVVIYAGATILGRVTIGHGSVIGGNVWLTHSVPPGSHVAQTQSTSQPVSTGV
ncbi:MAG: serine O-acetyltransferase EpsC [Betaproteobacteria bacterium]